MSLPTWKLCASLGLALLATSAGHAQDGAVPSVKDTWPTYNGDYSGRRYSQLKQIDRTNVGRLALAWAFPTRGATLKGTPLVLDGVLYLTAPDHVWALDAATGHQIWTLNRPSVGNKLSNRGVAYLKGKLYFGTPDAHLLCLDARSGKQLWDVQVADSSLSYYLAVAPLIVHDRVLIGTSGDGADIPHFLEALDPDTGKTIWRFDSVPKPGEPGSETWSDPKVMAHGGGGMWLTGTYDPALNLVYWGTGNPHPALDGLDRKGANLYTNTILAIDPDTGKLVWHYQPMPHDTHDWDAVETPVLFDTDIAGKPRKLLAQASRNGYFFVLDRTTGQHIVTTQFTPESWASGLDTRGQPVSGVNLEPQPQGTLTQGSANGGTNWMPPSYDPETRLFYVSAQQGYSFWYLALNEQNKPEDHQGGGAISLTTDNMLEAIDVTTGKIQWQRPTGKNRNTPGILTTAGHLLFTGDTSNNVIALDPADGKPLWHVPMGAGVTNGPMTYALANRQYVTMAVGDVLYTWTLPE